MHRTARGRTLVIRADADPTMGTGHVMRCLALAQEWKERGGRVVLVTACKLEGLLDRFAEEGAEVVRLSDAYPHPGDLAVTERVLRAQRDAWLVLDGYHFVGEYQSCVSDLIQHVMVLDDNAHLAWYRAEIILNQNIHAASLALRYPVSCRLLLGPRFVLLRREFRALERRTRTPPRIARRVLVVLGGTDPGNVTLKVLNALRAVAVPSLEVVVLLGAANRHRREVVASAERMPFAVQLERDSRNVSRWMLWAELAVAGAGTVAWELCYLGLPMVLIPLADNQRLLAHAFADRGLAALVSDADVTAPGVLSSIIQDLAYDHARRCEIGARCVDVVDGQGAVRVVDELLGDQGA